MKIIKKIKTTYSSNYEYEYRIFNYPIFQFGKVNFYAREIYYDLFPQLSKCYKNRMHKLWNSILTKLDRKYDHIFIMRTVAIGEAYFFTLIVDQLLKKYHVKNACIVYTSKKQKDIFELFTNIPSYEIDFDKQILAFYIKKLDYKYKNYNFHIFHCSDCISQEIFDDIAHNKLILSYPEIINNLWGIKQIFCKQPHFSDIVQQSLCIKLKTCKLNLNKFIFLVPQANALEAVHIEFWNKIINELNKLGFDSFYNIDSFSRYSQFPLLTIAEAVLLASKSLGIIALRCGFSEVLSSLDLPMHVIYSDEKSKKLSSKKMLDIYSLKKYPLMSNDKINEYDINELGEDYIINKIMESFYEINSI